MNSIKFAGLFVSLLMATGSGLAQDAVTSVAAPSAANATLGATPMVMKRASSAPLDLRSLPKSKPSQKYWPRRPDPMWQPVEIPSGAPPNQGTPPAPAVGGVAAPAPTSNFAGLDFLTWGAGHPPDTNGDVGPTHYIQLVNSAVGVYRKSDGVELAAFSIDTLMSQGNFGNLCDTNNFGDPVVMYDSFEDRWVITDFAFQVDGSGNVINPPGSYQCFAVSKSGDPVSGGWNFYSMQIAGGLNDYSKFGIWPDGIYMSTNMFSYASGGAYLGPRAYALNKAQMYAGEPTVQIVQFDVPSAEFTLLPANARLQAGAPPLGSPNYYSVVWQYTNAVSVYKFHVDWNRVSLSSFTGPFIAIAPGSWISPPATTPTPGNALDTLSIRLMMQNQYTNIGGVESLWDTHTVRGSVASTAAPRYYQTTVTGGTVAGTTTQAYTHAPDASVNRYMPSLAVNRVGDMAIGYTASSSTLNPAIRYAGRLASDPVNSLPQTEASLVEGTGTQTGTCGGTCTRWGDYSAMTLDPDGCTFWYTNEYYIANGLDWQTRVGKFAFPTCVPVASGTLQGTVTATVGGAPISGATVTFGSRTTTTDPSGFYGFPTVPSGTYASVGVSAPGYVPGSASTIVVSDGNTTTQNFSLGQASASMCFVDTLQSDFQTGVGTNADMVSSPDNVILLDAATIDQQNTTLSNSGVGITVTTWGGQTFTPSVTGQLTQVDVNLFCSGCTGTTPNLTLSVRATSSGLPTGADLATATVAGFSSGSSGYYTASFGVPPTLTAGTQYALIIRPTANPSPGTYALTRSSTDVFAGGTRVSGATSGTVWSIPLTSGASTDAGFKVYMKTGFSATGSLVSSVKDGNPATGTTPTWTSLAWTDAVPANTNLQFQVAASNAASGPFNFVGPDGTAATFFTSTGASLGQFDGNRYLKYKAYLSTTDQTVTPTLNDVTACFQAMVPSADLAVSNVDSPDPVTAGTNLTYTVTVSNNGPSAAANAAWSDTLPAGTSFVSLGAVAGWSCTTPAVGAGGTVSCSNASMVTGSVGFTLVAAVAPTTVAGTVLSNTVTVTSATGDPTPGNNSATTTTMVAAAADLAITNVDSPDPVTAGTNLTYTVTVSNNGPSSAASAAWSDTLPAGTSFVSLGAAAGWSCTTPAVGAGGTLSCSNASIASGANAVFTLTVAVAPATAGGTVLSNTATVTSATSDPTPGNNSATTTTTVTAAPGADLAISIVDSPDPVTAGTNLTYTVTVSNNGPSAAASAAWSDTLPASTSFVSLGAVAGWSCTTPAVGAGGTVSCSNASMVSGANAVFALTVAVPAATAGGTVLSNTATVTSATSDPTPANNSATATTTVTVAPGADLAISIVDSPDPVTAGTNLTYTVTVSNNGPSAATNVAWSDTLPASTSFVSLGVVAGWSCTTPAVGAIGSVSCSKGSLAVGSATFALVVAVAPPALAAGSVLSNTVTVSSSTSDPTPGNNTATATTAVTVDVVPTPEVTIPLLSISPGCGLVTWPSIVDLSGGEGPALVVDMVTILSNTLGMPLRFVEQTTCGSVILAGYNGGNLAFIPFAFQTGDNRPNGIYPVGNGQYHLVRDSQQLTLAPALVHLEQLAALLPGVAANQLDSGAIRAAVNGLTYVVQPGVAVQLGAAGGSPQLQLGGGGQIHFVDALGNNQVLAPAFAEPATLRNILQSLDFKATLSIQLDGTATIQFNGQRYTLVPDLTLAPVPADRAGQDWWKESETRFRVVNMQTVPLRSVSQGLTVGP